MSRAIRIASSVSVAVIFFVNAISAADPVRLKYLQRYDHGIDIEPKHVMSARVVLDHYALISSYKVLCLIDLEVPPPLTGCHSLLREMDATTTTPGPDGYLYVNLRNGGFAVVYLDASSLSLTLVDEFSEPDVFFDKMFVAGDRLYVTAHSYGIRIYDIANPAVPSLIGSLATGFDDAFDIAVMGNTAYVADGAGGLKIVDLADETAPVIIDGEDPTSAAGTSEAVTITNGHVYVAAGGAGVAVYDLGDLSSRTLYNTPVCAKNLARVGNYLAVADIGGVQIFGLEADGSLTPVTSESAMFRYPVDRVSLRLWHGVGAWGSDRLLVSDWDTLDVYELVDPATETQPDITPSTQRIRFAFDGGATVARMTNDGSGPLTISSIYSSHTAISVQPNSAVLQPGQFVDLSIEYSGTEPASGLILVESDDPDEDPLPIQVYGETPYLDPGEPAIPFTLETWTMDHETKRFTYGTFDLQAHAGRIVYFHVFAVW